MPENEDHAEHGSGPVPAQTLTDRIEEIVRRGIVESTACSYQERGPAARRLTEEIIALAETHYRPRITTTDGLMALPDRQVIIDRLGIGRQRQKRIDGLSSWTSPDSTGVWPGQVPLPAIAMGPIPAASDAGTPPQKPRTVRASNSPDLRI